MNVGVLSEVVLSVFEVPVSLLESRSGAEIGEVGGVVSIVIDNVPEDVLSLPASSVNVAVIECPPGVNGETVIEYRPPLQVCEPTGVAPSYIVTVSPLVQVPVNVGVVSFVSSSVFEVPVSLLVVRSGAEPGAAGAIVSIFIDKLGESELSLP